MFRCAVRGTVCANFVDSSGGDAENLDVLSVRGTAAGGIWRIDRRLKKASSRAEGVFVATWSVCSIHTDAGGAARESIH